MHLFRWAGGGTCDFNVAPSEAAGGIGGLVESGGAEHETVIRAVVAYSTML